MDIVLGPDGATLSLMRDNRSYTRPVDTKELMGIMQEHCLFDTGLLPPNTRYFSIKGDRLIAVVEFPYSKRTLFVKHDFSHITHTLEDVPIAGGLFFFDVQITGKTHKLNKLLLWGLPKCGLQSLDDTLYRYPAPNVEPSGRICWGGYQYKLFADMKAVSALEGVVRAYFRTNFNDHIWSRGALDKSFPWGSIDPMKIELYFKKLIELGDFDDKWLVKSGSTLRSVLDSYGIKM